MKLDGIMFGPLSPSCIVTVQLFLTAQCPMLFTVGYFLVYLAEANSCCMVHLHVKFFYVVFIIPFVRNQ